MPIKYSLEDCKRTAVERDGICLSIEYKNANYRMEWKCNKCNYEWRARYFDIKNRRSWCPKCVGKSPHTLTDCQKIAEERNGKCLSNEYKNTLTKMEWYCNKCSYVWKSTFNEIKNGKTWCPKCAGNIKLTLEECKKIAEERNGKCLSTKYINCDTLMNWKCGKCYYEWSTSFDHIKYANAWCPKCAGKLPYTLEECQKTAKERNGKCLSKEYKNIDTIMEWECQKGHKWKTRFDCIKNRKTWCPTCAHKSYSQACIKWLKTLPDYDDIEHAENGGEHTIKGRLKADGYNPKTNTIYEFHGCYWHGCPKCYKDRDTIIRSNKSREKVYQDTLKKEQKIKDLGYNLHVCWEHENCVLVKP